ncbi:MAG: glycosyltransferase family 9 protein [Candidatus Omnitrophota bacterium]|nr:glycosyltransferase family 9 protein [Candidatus Omnitrophota bacterium]
MGTTTPHSALRTPHSPLSQRVLIIGPSNIGDAILAGGVVAAVRAQHPDAHLTLVVGERAQALFAGDPRIQTLVNADAFSSPVGRLRLAWSLWRYQPQVIVDLRHTLYPLLLAPFTFWRFLRQPPKDLQHMRERHLWKLRTQVPATAESASSNGALWVSPKDTAHVEQLLKRWRLDTATPLVVICPGARSHIKRWTAEGFAALADRLITEASTQVVFSGEPDEEAVVEEVMTAMRQPAHSAVGLTTIRQAAALMQRARLVITNDSASLHLASALKVPTVAIFGPTDADKYGPTAPKHRTIRRHLFCSPCEQALCRFNHECMRFISADEVYAAARQLLEAGSRKLEAGKDKPRHA